MIDLSGKVAVVTGGSRGIGRAAALALARGGADVVIASRDVEACARTAVEIEALGRRALAVRCDVASAADVAGLFDRVDTTFGRCDVLVNNAGMASIAPAESVPLDEVRRVFDVHYLAALGCAQAALPRMRRHGGGAIVNVASIWAFAGQRMAIAYGGAKAALVHLTKALASEWARDGVRVNAVVPGLIETDMTGPVLADPGMREKMLRNVPLRRAGTPDEVGVAIAFLASPAASYITGALLFIDGGVRAR